MALQTSAEIHKEMGRIYRLARRGLLDTAELSRLANVLFLMHRVVLDQKLVDVESRLAFIEQAKNDKAGAWSTFAH